VDKVKAIIPAHKSTSTTSNEASGKPKSSAFIHKA
jgi:hypothetical protein